MKAGEIDINPYLEKLGALPNAVMGDLTKVLTSEATLAVWNNNPKVPGVINITPPFSQRAKDGPSALAAGKLAIRRDLGAVFNPVQLKGKRAITQVFGRKLTSPIYVPTKEKYPDVAAIAQQRWKRKNENKSKIMSRGQRAAYYVDKSKLIVVMRESYDLIGLACACWYLAAIEAKLNPRGVPDWIRKHSTAFSAGSFDISATSLRIELSSSLPYNTALGMAEKMARVIGYRKGALDRRLPYILAAAARKAQLAA